ncbi:MAG TPA: NERD domain-containing protein/DEAD/DEAH box helicase [Edaphobacter sp.]
MARLFPATLGTETPESERKVHSILKLGLSDDWVVVHGVAWQGLPRESRPPEDREVDFLVGHRGLGALLIEVKGGAVRYDEAGDRWTSQDRGGKVWDIKNPFRQARTACNSLMEVLVKTRRLSPSWGPFGWTVWFPDGQPTQALLELPDDLILTFKDLSSGKVAARIEHILQHYQRAGKKADATGLDLLVNTVRHDYRIESPFKVAIDGVERSIIDLSQQQYRVLDGMRRNRRVAVEGCAGSGKTLLAVEQARRLASQGLSTLLTCFNTNLAGYLEQSVGTVDHLTISTFHGIAREVMAKAGVRWPAVANQDFFKKVPDLVVTALQKYNPKFDAIVVDEAQDFDQNWWYPLIYMLGDPNEGILYLFSDNNQSLYDRPRGLPEK